MDRIRQKTVVVLLGLAAANAGAIAASPVESHDDIRAAAERHVLAGAEGLDGRIEVTAGSLDSRLRLAACDVPLETYDSPNGLNGGRGVVGVRCNGSRPWKLYVPVTVANLQHVVVSRRPLVRGQSLRADDLMLSEVDTSRLHKAYFTRIEDLIGLRVKRGVESGSTLHVGLVQRDNLVKRGSQVTIVSNLDGLSVTMRGEAMADGTRGERIQAKNLSSGRVVTGTVTGSGKMEILN